MIPEECGRISLGYVGTSGAASGALEHTVLDALVLLADQLPAAQENESAACVKHLSNKVMEAGCGGV